MQGPQGCKGTRIQGTRSVRGVRVQGRNRCVMLYEVYEGM